MPKRKVAKEKGPPKAIAPLPLELAGPLLSKAIRSGMALMSASMPWTTIGLHLSSGGIVLGWVFLAFYGADKAPSCP